MATSITLTMPPPTEVEPLCPGCGINLSSHPATLDAQKQIEELQVQVRLLTEKATVAVDKWADYEDEIQRLRTQTNQQFHDNPPESAISSVPFDERLVSSNINSPASAPGGIQNRLSSFLVSRISTSNLRSLPVPPLPPLPSSVPPTPSTNDLVVALNREQSLREGAERKLDEVSGELEELSTQLFIQANEMVATERMARAKLEQRVEILERRDNEKRKRLEKLESAVQRIDRVRELLSPGTPRSPR